MASSEAASSSVPAPRLRRASESFKRHLRRRETECPDGDLAGSGDTPCPQESWWRRTSDALRDTLSEAVIPQFFRSNERVFHDERLHAKGVFDAIRRGASADEVLSLLAQEDDPVTILQGRDAVGAAPVHFAFLCYENDIGKALVEKYPSEADLQYTKGPYEGENILHIAIIHQDPDLVEWLLERHPHLLTHETVGKFFAPAGRCYFGGFPLMFAVATNQTTILDRILATRAADGMDLHNSLVDRDAFGNTCLHVAVIHDLPRMYDAVLERAEREGLNTDRMQCTPNNERLTPMALAAAMGQVRMFEHILMRSTKVLWESGNVMCKKIPLRGLEQPYHEVCDGRPLHTAIQCLCASKEEPLTNCLPLEDGYVPKEVMLRRLKLVADLPEVKRLLDDKWSKFGKWLFYLDFIVLLFVQIVWAVAVIIPKHYYNYDIADYPVENAFVIACEACVMVYVIWKLGRMFRKYATDKTLLSGCFRKRDRGGEGPSGPNNLMSCMNLNNQDLVSAAFCITFIIGWALTLAGIGEVGKIFLAFASLTNCVNVVYSLIGFRSLGPYIVMVKEIIIYDFTRFFVVYMIIQFGFTMAAHFLLDLCSANETPSFFRHMISFMLTTIGIYPFAEYTDGADYWLTNILLLVYMFLEFILLLNLLVATMNNTYATVKENGERRWHVERANIMHAYEKTFSWADMQLQRCKYAEPTEIPDPTGPHVRIPVEVDFHYTMEVRVQTDKLRDQPCLTLRAPESPFVSPTTSQTGSPLNSARNSAASSDLRSYPRCSTPVSSRGSRR